MKIRFVPVPARKLVSVREHHPIWRDEWIGAGGRGAEGYIVRILPPATATEERIASVVRTIENAGAVRIKVVSRESPPEVVRRIAGDPSPSKISHRAVVERMADEARSRDRSALKALLDEVMTEEGL